MIKYDEPAVLIPADIDEQSRARSVRAFLDIVKALLPLLDLAGVERDPKPTAPRLRLVK
jgi:hypothetical protein